MPRFLGCRPSPEGATVSGWAKDRRLAAGPIPYEAYFATGLVLDQLEEDCLANAAESAKLDKRWEIAGPDPGIPPELDSRRWGYLGARMLAGEQAENAGSRPADYFAWQKTRGFPKERYWPYVGPTAFDQPPPLAEEHAIDQKGKILAHRATSWEQVQRGMLAGAKAIACAFVDQALLDYENGIWTFGGAIKGGHAFQMVGWTGDVGWAKNSWSDRYGVTYPGPRTPDVGVLDKFSGGFFKIGASTLNDPGVLFEYWLVDFVPTSSEDKVL